MPAVMDPPAPVDAPPPPPPDIGDDDHGGNGEGPWVTVARYRSTFEAHLARLKLQSEEIDSVILEENVANMPLFGVFGGGAMLQVPRGLVEAARAVLADVGSSRYITDAETDWKPIARFETPNEGSLAAAVLETHGFRVGLDEVAEGPHRGESLLHVPVDEMAAARGVLKASPAGSALLSEAEMHNQPLPWSRPPWIAWLLVLLVGGGLLMAGFPGLLAAMLAIAGWFTFTGMRDDPHNDFHDDPHDDPHDAPQDE